MSVENWKGKVKFLKLLKKREKLALLKIKNKTICGNCGAIEVSMYFIYKGWCWTSSLFQNVKDNNIKPAQEFIDWICNPIEDKIDV